MPEVHYSAFYEASLAGKKPDIAHDTPEPGLYRDGNDYGSLPVRYWQTEAGDVLCSVDGKIVDRDRAEQKWPFVAWSAVSYDWWRHRSEKGHWPDQDPIAVGGPKRGHNRPPEDDSPEAIQGQIEAAAARLTEYREITSDEQATRAQTVRSRLLELSGKADKLRETAKKPHLEAGKTVDATWNPLVKAAKAAADVIRAAMGAWETQKHRAEAEKRAQEPAGVTDPAAATLPPPVRIKGSYGRTATVKQAFRAEIVDQDLVYRAFRQDPDLKACLQTLAQRAVNAGLDIEGIRVVEERKVV